MCATFSMVNNMIDYNSHQDFDVCKEGLNKLFPYIYIIISSITSILY